MFFLIFINVQPIVLEKEEEDFIEMSNSGSLIKKIENQITQEMREIHVRSKKHTIFPKFEDDQNTRLKLINSLFLNFL